MLGIPAHHQIIDAIESQDLEQTKRLFRNFPEYVEFEFLGSWLHNAARFGALEIVKYLISIGFDVNKGDKHDGITPLASACSGGHYDVVEYLLNNGAMMDVTASVRNPLFASITESVKEAMNKTWGPSTGEAPRIVRLLLERGIDSRKRYNTRTMKNMDAVAFARMMGAREIAHIIALWNAGNDEDAARVAIAEADQIAEANVKPVPKGEQVAPS